MMQIKLKGVIVPVITPVDDRDRVDEPAFRQVIRYVLDAGVDGMFVGGSAGEGPLLTADQWDRMIETAIDEAGEDTYLLGGAIDTSTERVLGKIRQLKGAGYHNIVVAPTFYTSIKAPDEHLRLFGAAKEACGDSELIAYNIPSCTGSEIAVATMCEMAKRGWIRYCKESSGNLDYFRRLLEQGKEAGLKAFMGDEAGISEGLLMGACGVVPVCANYEPETFIKAYKAGIQGNRDEIRQLQQRIDYLRQRLPLAGACWIAGVKYAVASLGIGSGKPVSPLQPLDDRQKAQINELTAARLR
ncbi:MAG: dihydrodipicolinate synthase family protein [Armatimonadota bacterium]